MLTVEPSEMSLTLVIVGISTEDITGAAFSSVTARIPIATAKGNSKVGMNLVAVVAKK